MVIEMDTASDESVRKAAADLETALGKKPPPLYAIVNNAGIASGTVAEILNVNVRGPKRVDDAFGPLLDPLEGRVHNAAAEVDVESSRHRAGEATRSAASGRFHV